MKRRILLVITVVFIFFGLFVFFKFLANIIEPRGKGALQVTTNIKAQVFLNDKNIGNAPISLLNQDQRIDSGDYSLKVVPEDKSQSPYNARITINPNVLTAVDRTFLPGSIASSYIATLEKNDSSNPQLFIASVPDGALVSIDGDSQGITPLDVKTISASEHEVEIEKPGFSKKTIRVRTVADYKLVLNVVLGTETTGDETLPENTSPTPAPSTAVSPTPSTPMIVIKDTPTGFLRVRSDSSVTSSEVARVNPGETYPLLDENDEWYKIQLKNGLTGWVSKTYANKQP
ncbi:MAG TPA: PEGA domain-containing protein [Patescibacteria group bacterium]|nr:PEGA domain-containing protein [Patescibacteria group bacterium]